MRRRPLLSKDSNGENAACVVVVEAVAIPIRVGVVLVIIILSRDVSSVSERVVVKASTKKFEQSVRCTRSSTMMAGSRKVQM